MVIITIRLNPQQLFDEGHNLVSMNLPNKIQKKVAKPIDEPTTPTDEPATAALKNLDVEYEDNYDVVEYHQKKSEFAKLKAEQDRIVSQMHSFSPVEREYSIDSWNGSPGLQSWGYDDLAVEG